MNSLIGSNGGFAESAGAEGLVIAAHGGDHAIYPDCREDFMRAMGEAMRLGTYAGVQLLRPSASITGRSTITGKFPSPRSTRSGSA